MKLTSCDNCAVVLDADKIVFPDKYGEDNCINPEHAVWINREYVAFVPCPVCSKPITDPKETGT